MNCVKDGDKKNKITDYAVFAVLLMVYTGIMTVLFYRQAFGSEMLYHSDMKAYILEMQGLDSGYRFPYPLFFKLGAFFHLFIGSPQVSVVVALTLLNSLSVVALKYYADAVLLPAVERKTPGRDLSVRLLITAAVFTLFFVSMLYSVTGLSLPGIHRRYLGVFSPNPYHNATYMATRPFAVVSFFIFVRVLQNYEKKICRKDCLLFAIFLFLTTITKPSFTFVLVPAAGIIMLYRLFQKRFKNLVPSLLTGLCFLPTFGALYYQYFGVFGPVDGEETGIGFGLAEAWQYSCDNIPLAIALAMGFPVMVLILNWQDLKTDGVFRFAWQITAVSLLEVLFLYEKGFRLKDMNFSWGYMHGLFFAFAASLFVLLRKTWNRKKDMSKWGKMLVWAQWAVYGWYVLCGLWYFRSVFLGELYY